MSDTLEPRGPQHTRLPWYLILCHSLLLLPSIFPSTRVFSNELLFTSGGPKYWSFSISPSNEYSGLISFRIDWFDHLAIQGTLKSLLQHHSSKASTLRHLAFFLVQLFTSNSYMITGKTIALTIWTADSKVISLLFNMLSGFVTAFLPMSKHLLISWCDFGAQENKIYHCFQFFHFCLP